MANLIFKIGQVRQVGQTVLIVGFFKGVQQISNDHKENNKSAGYDQGVQKKKFVKLVAIGKTEI
jgi:hypothetical protein